MGELRFIGYKNIHRIEHFQWEVISHRSGVKQCGNLMGLGQFQSVAYRLQIAFEVRDQNVCFSDKRCRYIVGGQTVIGSQGNHYFVFASLVD